MWLRLQIKRNYHSTMSIKIVDAPWHISNHTLHENLHISTVQEIIQGKTNKHHRNIVNRPNPLIGTIIGTKN